MKLLGGFANSAALVGTPRQVMDSMKAYRALGDRRLPHHRRDARTLGAGAGRLPLRGQAGAVSGLRIREISPRLGLQSHLVETSQKVELVQRLIAAGLKAVEVSSFVSPRLVPGLADAEEVFSRVGRPQGVSLECCVGNVTGLKRAIEAGADAALVPAGHRRGVLRRATPAARSPTRCRSSSGCAASPRGPARGLGTYMIAAWGGPAGLARTPADLQPLADRLLAIDVRDWILADSCGYAAAAADPRDGAVGRAADRDRAPGGARCTTAAAWASATWLNSPGWAWRTSTCRWPAPARTRPRRGLRPGASAPRDAVQMLELMGFETGLDLSALIDTANWARWASGRPGEGLRPADRAGADERDADGAGPQAARALRVGVPDLTAAAAAVQPSEERRR